MSSIKVSVVIPNYNGEKFLLNCVDSLMAQNVRNFEIIVVDDGSKDDSMKQLSLKYPDNGALPRIRYIYNNENKGFCASVNIGIKNSEAEYVLLLNNDTEVMPDFVCNMYRAIKRSDKIFSVGAKMVSLTNPEIMDNAGDMYCILGWAFTPAKDKPVEKYRKRKKIFSACGGAAIYRKSILDKIGLFDENHFAYLEDVDIGYRALLYGYKNVYEPTAVVKHAGSATTGSRYNDFKAKYTARNNLYLIYKNMPSWQKIINGPWIVIGFIIKLIFYTSKGLGKSYFDGIKEGLSLSKSIEGKKHLVDFKKVGVLNCIKTELLLIANTIERFFVI